MEYVVVGRLVPMLFARLTSKMKVTSRRGNMAMAMVMAVVMMVPMVAVMGD